MLRQTEEDADKEILELKTKYEKTLRFERETNVRLRGEAGIVKKKLQAVLKVCTIRNPLDELLEFSNDIKQSHPTD